MQRFLSCFFLAKVSITDLKSNDDVTSLSIVNIKDKPSKCSCVIQDLSRVLIHFNAEKDLSLEQLVHGIVKYICNNISILGNV